MGQKTESFKTAISDYQSSRCFSIVLRDNTTVDLVALVPNEAYIWVKGLRCLVTGGLGRWDVCSSSWSKELGHVLGSNYRYR